MKITIDKNFLREMRGRYEGNSIRVGILKNKRYQPAAPKAEGLTSVLGGPARKTEKGRLAEINTQLKKMREQAAAVRAKAKAIREKAHSLRATGKTAKAKSKSLEAKKHSAKARGISDKARELRLTKVKPRKATLSLRDVIKRAQRATGINFLRLPFQKANSRAYRKFVDAYMKAASKQRSMTKVEALLLDVVVRPILEKRYGRNSPGTKEAKGFNRRFIDTGQMIKGISAEIKKKKQRTRDV